MSSRKAPTSMLLDPMRLSPTELGSWAELADGAATANAFLDPCFVRSAVRHLPGGRRARLLVVASSSRRWRALAVVVPGERWRRLPVPALGTWVHDQQGLATPLLAGDEADGAARALVAAVGEHAPWARVFGLDEHAAQSRTALALDAALHERGWRRTLWRSSERAVLLRGRPMGPILEEPARLRSKRRRLEREVGPVWVRDCSDPDGAEFGARTLLRLEAGGWKGRQATAMTQRRGEAELLLDVAREGAHRGVLRSLVLMAGDSPVAAQLDLVSAGTWFHWKTAYDEAHSATSPGRLLLTHVLARFDREGLDCWDACTAPGHHVMDGLLPDRRTIVEVAATRGPGPRAVVRAGLALRHRREGAA